jgi:hypothetical protein
MWGKISQGFVFPPFRIILDSKTVNYLKRNWCIGPSPRVRFKSNFDTPVYGEYICWFLKEGVSLRVLDCDTPQKAVNNEVLS